ncbi:hypothetical protein GUJ93_ZPchr0002g23286 [Zizania palustris]|uniref:Uncharacterized protein n=1 Tax=Zizania palustris TaxID=103762 RepID=A0A8J5RUF7_ZIZPA|nr:hypothetical protein GUJ93_ZPchr0002g23286 [Zizania palustris]
MRVHEAHWRSLEGRGWKSRRRRRSRPDGLIICSRCARTDRPFALAATLASPRPVAPVPPDDDGGRTRGLRWRMQRKEPGWLVGAQRQVSLGLGAADLELEASQDRTLAMSGSIDRSIGVVEGGGGGGGFQASRLSVPVFLYARAGAGSSRHLQLGSVRDQLHRP